MEEFVHRGQRYRIRPVGAGDGKLLYRCFQGFGSRTRTFFHPHDFDRQTARLLTAEEVACSRDERRFLMLALGRKGRGWKKPVGYGLILRMTSEVPVLGLALIDAFQGQGLGTRLLEFLIVCVRSQGAGRVKLTVLEENGRARYLYRKMGFRIVAGGGHIDRSVNRPALTMARDLGMGEG